MATFRYFRTFIDEEVERPFPWLSRGRSCPLLQQEDTREMDMEQSFEVDYVSQLGRSQGMSVDLTNAPQQQPNTLEIGTVKEEAKVLDEPAEPEPETTADSQTPAAEAAEVAPQHSQGSSFGSLGHPFLCRRPCIRFAKGNCDVGDACGYCHHSVHARFTHLDRRQRLQVRDMDLGALMATLLPHVRLCVQGAGLAANELIQLIQSEAIPLAQSQRDKSLDRTLRQMPLSALLALVSGREGSFQPLLLQQVEFLRQRLP